MSCLVGITRYSFQDEGCLSEESVSFTLNPKGPIITVLGDLFLAQLIVHLNRYIPFWDLNSNRLLVLHVNVSLNT